MKESQEERIGPAFGHLWRYSSNSHFFLLKTTAAHFWRSFWFWWTKLSKLAAN